MRPFFLGTVADAKAQPFVSPTVLIRQFIFKFTTHIDGSRRQMLCKFEKISIVTFEAKYPFFAGTPADAKAQPFVMTYPSNLTCTH